MRTPPLMSVEVSGRVERRPGVLEVLLYDSSGRPTVTRLRPQMSPGEVLRERVGTFPVIVREVA